MDLMRFTLELRTALYQCGQVATALQGTVRRENKPPDSPVQQSTSVSVVDRLCQELILLKAFEIAPEMEIYSEELFACPPHILGLSVGNRHRYALIIDPVDGTEDYLDGLDTYAHVLGLLDQEAGAMDIGMFFFPASCRLFIGMRGQGAYEAQGLWTVPMPMTRVEPERTVGDIKRLTPQDYEVFARHGFELLPQASRSAAYELMRVAEGSLGALVMRDYHGHDTAMASVLIEALGGAMLGPDGKPVRYVREMPRMPLVVASLQPAWARELVKALS